MSYNIELLKQGGTVVLPSPEKAASISVIEIDREDYVKLVVEVSRSRTVTRVVRLCDVVALHEGPFKLETKARSPWLRGKSAQDRLTERGNRLSGFVAVHKDAQVLLEITMGTSAAECLAVEEYVTASSPIADFPGPVMGAAGTRTAGVRCSCGPCC
jgi:hypothetical protein